eukprot:g1029.t1
MRKTRQRKTPRAKVPTWVLAEMGKDSQTKKGAITTTKTTTTTTTVNVQRGVKETRTTRKVHVECKASSGIGNVGKAKKSRKPRNEHHIFSKFIATSANDESKKKKKKKKALTFREREQKRIERSTSAFAQRKQNSSATTSERAIKEEKLRRKKEEEAEAAEFERRQQAARERQRKKLQERRERKRREEEKKKAQQNKMSGAASSSSSASSGRGRGGMNFAARMHAAETERRAAAAKRENKTREKTVDTTKKKTKKLPPPLPRGRRTATPKKQPPKKKRTEINVVSTKNVVATTSKTVRTPPPKKISRKSTFRDSITTMLKRAPTLPTDTETTSDGNFNCGDRVVVTTGKRAGEVAKTVEYNERTSMWKLLMEGSGDIYFRPSNAISSDLDAVPRVRNVQGKVESADSESRAEKAKEWVNDQVLVLLRTVSDLGGGDSGRTTFAKLFVRYERISDSLNGILMRAKKRGLVQYKGEMLLQRVSDAVVISLTEKGRDKLRSSSTMTRKAPKRPVANSANLSASINDLLQGDSICPPPPPVVSPSRKSPPPRRKKVKSFALCNDTLLKRSTKVAPPTPKTKKAETKRSKKMLPPRKMRKHASAKISNGALMAVAKTKGTIPSPVAVDRESAGDTKSSEDPRFAKFQKMLKMHLPALAVRAKMKREGFLESEIDACIASAQKEIASAPVRMTAREQPKFAKYAKMLRLRVPLRGVLEKMKNDGVSAEDIFAFRNNE